MGKRLDKLMTQVRIIHPEYDSLSPERQMQILADTNNHYHSRRSRGKRKSHNNRSNGKQRKR